MQPRNLDDLSKEIIAAHIVPELNLGGLNAAMQVSKTCLSMFHSPLTWKKRFEIDFGISEDTLNRFSDDVLEVVGCVVDYQFIYRQRDRITQLEARLPSEIRFSYSDPQFHFHLLTCCLANVDYARHVFSSDEYDWWMPMAEYDPATYEGDGEIDEDSLAEIYVEAELGKIFDSGDLEALKRYIQRQYPAFFTKRQEVQQRAEAGNFYLFLFLGIFESLFVDFGKSANLNLVKYCHEELGLPITPNIMKDIIIRGNSLVFDYALEKCREIPDCRGRRVTPAQTKLSKVFHQLQALLKNLSAKPLLSMKEVYSVDEMTTLYSPIIRVCFDALLHVDEYGLDANRTKQVLDLLRETMMIKSPGLIEAQAVRTQLLKTQSQAREKGNSALLDGLEQISEILLANNASARRLVRYL